MSTVKLQESTAQNSEFEALLSKYDYNFKKGDLIKGIVIGYEGNNVLVDVGAKTSATVPFKEASLDNTKDIKEVLPSGSEHEFLIIKEEDENGRFTLSLKRVLSAYSWQKIEDAKREDLIIEGKVLANVKGGLLVDIFGIRGFVPTSHIPRSKEGASLVGETLELKILSADFTQNNLILSNKKISGDIVVEKKKDIIEKLKPGQIIEGEVVRITDFGAFINIGGIDGLLPLSQVSWKWVDHPSDILKVGEIVKVEIIGIDFDKERVSLSLKSLQPDPWDEAKAIIKDGAKIKGVVTRLRHFGAFIEVFPGVEALLPQKDVVDYQNKTGKTLELNKELETTILKFNPDDKRISLTLFDKEE
jgi:small subunit ribosomal protein S1